MEPSLYCPFCGDRLTMVSRRQDYFCGPCHAAVCLDGETSYVYRMGLDQSFCIATQTLLQPSAS